ncbi:MAG: KH domain-containing protein [Clostridia bacterium]|nr:KH domain-containing protein [Clostridia bacterium]
MKEILESMITNLVDNTQAVSITEKQEEKTVTYTVKVAQEDMGKVIGKQGRIAKAIRTVMKSLGAKEHKRIVVEFID